ncbi:MAG TPA: SIR2 family protein [Solirubrobacterales bacterium]|nr:SIR2 family protein [Solirubrobacterales bacterium]
MSMKLLTPPFDDWTEVEPDSDAERVLNSKLEQMLGAERLMVLTGLGTSTGIRVDGSASGGPGMTSLWTRAKAAAGDEQWDAALESAGWSSDFQDDIELLLSRCQMAHTLDSSTGLDQFIALCEAEIVAACDFISDSTPLPVHESFLRRIARRPARLPRTQIFTTNYDLAFEVAASRTGFALIDGFSHVSPQRFDSSYFDVDYAFRDRERAATPVEWMRNVVHLLKLHGSVDWIAKGGGVERHRSPDRPLIIYPRASKFEISYQQPFLELMARFQTGLRRPDTAIFVIGSGLGADQHLAEPIRAAARSNVRLSIVVVSRSLSSKEGDTIDALKAYAAGGDRRVTLIESTFEQFVPVLPDLVPETEAEKHASRAEP